MLNFIKDLSKVYKTLIIVLINVHASLGQPIQTKQSLSYVHTIPETKLWVTNFVFKSFNNSAGMIFKNVSDVSLYFFVFI